MSIDKCILASLLLMVCNTAICQKQIDKIDNQTLSQRLTSTPDKLFWHGAEYLIERPFLSAFKGYKTIYPDVPAYEISYAYGTMGGPSGQNYYPVWLLQDSVLTLCEIGFYEDDVSYLEEKIFKEKGKQYKIMEKLTGQKFQKDNARAEPDSIPRESPVGSMPAKWVNGVFYVKEIRSMFELNPDQWEQLPFQKLTFQNGKLTAAESVRINSRLPDQK